MYINTLGACPLHAFNKTISGMLHEKKTKADTIVALRYDGTGKYLRSLKLN